MSENIIVSQLYDCIDDLNPYNNVVTSYLFWTPQPCVKLTIHQVKTYNQRGKAI